MVLAFYLQGRGGGLSISGTATLANTNVYDNQATVRVGRISNHARLQRPAELTVYPLPSQGIVSVDQISNHTGLQRAAGTLRVLAFCMQAGGGLAVANGGVANLDGCNVYSNEAEVSGSPYVPSQTFPPAPR